MEYPDWSQWITGTITCDGEVTPFAGTDTDLEFGLSHGEVFRTADGSQTARPGPVVNGWPTLIWETHYSGSCSCHGY